MILLRKRQRPLCGWATLFFTTLYVVTPAAQVGSSAPTARAVTNRIVTHSKNASPLDATYFEREVRPLLEKRCLGCHGVGAHLSGLDLRSRESALQGGTRGPAIVPGSAERSLLYKLVSGVRPPSMPPTGRLPTADVQTLKRWLDGGALWGSGALTGAKKQV